MSNINFGKESTKLSEVCLLKELVISSILFITPAFAEQVNTLQIPEKTNKYLFSIDDSINPTKDIFEVNRLENRLNTLIEIYANNDDLKPISEKAINNFKQILLSQNNNLLKNWNLFSNDKGALSLEYQLRDNALSSICISDNQISYFVDKKQSMRISGIEPFSPYAVIVVLSKVL